MPEATAAAPASGFRPSVFVQITPDNFVTIVCHRSEMGQGVRSSLPALIADELGASMTRVKVVQGDADKAYGDQNTDGSSSVRQSFTELRYLGATARARGLLDDKGLPWRLHVALGEPAERIIHRAVRISASGIVIGSRGLGVTESLLLGSVTSKLMHQGGPPLAIVP